MGRRKPGGSDRDDDDGDDEPQALTAKPSDPTAVDGKPIRDASTFDTKPVNIARPAEGARPSAEDLPEIEPPEPRDEPWPDATPQPMRPVAPAERMHQPTIGVPVVASQAAPNFGRPPDMPRTSAPPPLVLGDVENPAHMPGPRQIPGGNPEDPASAPGGVPPGDSRSLRRGDEFALVYRVGTCVITRTGRVGTRGAWRVVEYPTSAAASNSYARECSRFVSDGFSDYRE